MALTAAELIAQQTPEEHEHEFTLANGTVLKFKNVQDTRELAKIRKKAERYTNLKIGQIPEASRADWAPYMPIDEDTANIMARLTSLMTQPTFTDFDALKCCRDTGLFAAFLDQQIKLRLGARINQSEDEEVEAEKNASAPTDGGETTSPLAETASANTPSSSPTVSGDTPATSSPSA